MDYEAIIKRANIIEVGGEQEHVDAVIAGMEVQFITWHDRLRSIGRLTMNAAAWTGAVLSGLPYPYHEW